MLRHFILAISPLVLPTTERPYTVGPETYTLRVTPLPCATRQPCDTPFVPRRYRVEIKKDGVRLTYFEMPCVRGCEADKLARNVKRALHK